MESATKIFNTSDNRSDRSDRSVVGLQRVLNEHLHGVVFGIVSPENVDKNCVQKFEKCFKHVLQELKQKKNVNAKAKRDEEKVIAKAKKAKEKADLKAAAKAQKAEERAKIKAQKEKEKADFKAKKAEEKDAQRVERKRKREEEIEKKREEKKMCTTEGILLQVEQLTSNGDIKADSANWLKFKERFETFCNNKKKRRKVQTMKGLDETQKLIDSVTKNSTCPHAKNGDLLADVQTQQLIDVTN